MNTAAFVLDHALGEPTKVREILINMYQRGIQKEDLKDFIRELEHRKIVVENTSNQTAFDVCGTGGSGRQRINLSTALAIKLSSQFTIAKHGNRGASGRFGSCDIVEAAGLKLCSMPEEVREDLAKKNLAFLFAPAFHPALAPLAPIRKSIPHPTIFNFLGPLVNPLSSLTAQMIGFSDLSMGLVMARAAQELGKNVLLVHDLVAGLDEVSILGETKYFRVRKGVLEEGIFVPEDFGVERVQDFASIQGGETLEDNLHIFTSLLKNTAPEAHRKFLEINAKVATDFFTSCIS